MTGFPASLTTPSEQLCFLAIIGFHPPDVLEEINYSMYMVLKGGFFFHWVEERILIMITFSSHKASWKGRETAIGQWEVAISLPSHVLLWDVLEKVVLDPQSSVLSSHKVARPSKILKRNSLNGFSHILSLAISLWTSSKLPPISRITQPALTCISEQVIIPLMSYSNTWANEGCADPPTRAPRGSRESQVIYKGLGVWLF